MTVSISNPLVRLPLAAAAEPALPSELEAEVISLFDEFRNRLLRYALSFGLPVQDGEEVIQDVFLSLHRHLQLGRSRENLRGWLFRVAHNLSLKRRSIAHKIRKTMKSDRALVEKHLDPAPNPEERLAAVQRQNRLRAVLRALPEKDQCCLHLRAEGLRYREIAEVLDMSLGAVSISLTRSLARMERVD
ncbi:MAG TPA: sigma-70 family RNA polymerase sigma factor [Candidatus Acidoferrum sp.]|nr:sigma-70 family RNA polymerase sigma factor [Candidatus Acidoferrum sp.]